MDINTIYNKIFPIGGIDDNNRYVNLSGDQINTIQLVEPALSVQNLALGKKNKYDKNNIYDKYAYRIPYIGIDDYVIDAINLTAFKLDYNDFIPTVIVEFVDVSNDLLSTNVIKDGSIIKVYIGGNGDELFYKPIRQDFVITSVRKSGGNDQNNGGYLKYRLYGKLNVPYGYRKESWCCGKSTAMQALFNLSIQTGLGFATNFTNANTLDNMYWRNEESSTYFDFMQMISDHACYSPNTFFISFIDQFNVLNFVECHSLLSHGGKKTDIPSMIYQSYPPSELPEFDPSYQEKTTKNQIPLGDDEDDFYNKYQKVSYYYLSNNDFFNGWTNFIEEYTEINNGFSSLSDGYNNHVSYSDSNKGDWGFSVCEFNIRPIDNMVRESNTQKIKSLPDEPAQDSYIPLNLIHTIKREYVNDNTDVDDMTNVESFTSFGEVDTSNTYKQYFFAEAHNRYQLKCMKKCGLKVVLQNFNPAIKKYSRIWVDIYDKNMMSNTQITKSTIKADDSNDYNSYKMMKNENILKFEDEGIIESIENEEMKNKNWPRGEFNRALSGWYVITSMEINYSPLDNNLKMILILNRIEYQPCFKDEYRIAKKAIDKYKEENLVENLVTPKDDISYKQN